MIPYPYLRCLLAAVLLSTSIASPVRAALYMETFDTSSVNVSGSNWIIINSINVAGPAYGFIGKTTTATQASAPSNEINNFYAYAQNNTASPNNQTTTVDYFFRSSTTTTSPSLFSTLLPNSYSSMVASWQSTAGGTMTDGVTSMKYFLTVQVGSSWYAASTNGSAGYTAGTAGVNYTLDLLNTNWYTVSFNPGTSIGLNLAAGTTSSASLFSGNQQITGLGWYVKDLPGATGGGAADYRTIRFDNLAINVPEPTRATLFALAFTAFFFRRTRRN